VQLTGGKERVIEPNPEGKKEGKDGFMSLRPIRSKRGGKEKKDMAED